MAATFGGACLHRLREMDARSGNPTTDRNAIVTTTERPPCEHYARCTVTVVDDRPATPAKRLLELTVEPGVEVRDGDDLDALWLVLHSLALHIGDVVLRRGWTEAMQLVGVDFEHVWPGRAWFVELHDSAGRWTQSYQPYGIPRRATEEEIERQADQVMREHARHPMRRGFAREFAMDDPLRSYAGSTVHGCEPAISLAQCARYPDCERCGPERR
jgi:hypothetical protein